jgi:hypothetical protein
MAKKVQNRKKATRPIIPSTQTVDPEWVTSMHEYHRRTGLFRAEDLDRVLGDPRDQVTSPSSEDFALACGVPKHED